MSANLLEITEANFQAEVLDSPIPVLVDFWATWCAPCRMLTPTVEKIAGTFAGRAKVGKVDVDSNQGLAERYNVRGIPTLLLFKGGVVVEQSMGAASEEAIAQMISKNL